MEKFICGICGKEFKSLVGFGTHIGKFHKNEITREEYYLKFIGEKGKCAECGKDTNFITLRVGYYKFCSLKCSNNSIEVKNKMRETCLENSGYLYPAQDPKIKEKKKQTCLKNSGYDYPMQNPETREKSKQTNFEKTGYENTMQNPVTKEKHKQTCLEKTGYGHPMKNPEILNKAYETKLRNNNGIDPNRLTFQKLKERYPLLVQVEELKEGPNGEILAHCKNVNCKNSKENGGYFEPTIAQLNWRKQGIDKNDIYYLYCCEECKHSCPLFGRSGTELHNLINENPEIPYTSAEYLTWREEVYYRQRVENNTDTNFCEYCNSTENLHVHHIHPIKLEPGYVLDPINGIVFCEKCHYKIGHEKGTECSTGNLASKICK